MKSFTRDLHSNHAMFRPVLQKTPALNKHAVHYFHMLNITMVDVHNCPEHNTA